MLVVYLVKAVKGLKEDREMSVTGGLEVGTATVVRRQTATPKRKRFKIYLPWYIIHE